MKYIKVPTERITLIERFAISFFSAILAFITGSIVWGILGDPDSISFDWVYGFTVSMAVLGFLNFQNFIVKILGDIWRGL